MDKKQPPTLVTESEAFDSETWLRLVKTAYQTGQDAAVWPPAGTQLEEWKKIVDDLAAMQQYLKTLAAGDLSPTLSVKGQMAGSLKTLQANLRHLTWQVQRIANGDWTQKVEFMGDFSAAFNQMTESLSQTKRDLLASEARYRLLAENAGDVIWTLDLQGHCTYISPSVEKLRGYTVAEAIAQSVEESFAPESARLVQTKLSEIAAKKSTNQTIDRETFELEQPCKTGSKVWIEVTTTPLFNENGDLVGIQGASRDITERRRAQQAEKDQRTLAEALRDSAAALNKAFNLDEVYDALIVDIGRVVPHDSVHILMTGLDGITQIVRSSGFETVIENAALHLSAVLLNAAETENLKQMTITGNACRIADIRNYPWVETGLTGWAHSCLGAPIFIKNRVMGFIILLCKSENFFSEQHGDHLMAFSDQAAIAIEKAQLIAQLNQMATQDSLTQIFNRRAFFEKGDLEFERSIRYRHPLTTLMLDIDHFKMVNDTYGHSTGDQVLQGVSQICAQSIRKIDVLGRYGGEEFAIVFPEITDEKALEAAERIRLNIAQTPIATDRGPVQVTVSIGLAEYHPEIGSFRSLLDQADEALYQAKLAGRNQVKRLK